MHESAEGCPMSDEVMAVRHVGAGTSVIEIAGDLTAASESALMDAYTEAAEGDTHTVVIDFSGLEYMNSGGIGLLVTLLVRANRSGHKLLACGLDDHYKQILELTRLDEAITIYGDEAEALAAAGV
jgi:anti-sigma B factor antagonist